MLVLSRTAGQSIQIDAPTGPIVLTILQVRRHLCRLGISAGPDVRISRDNAKRQLPRVARVATEG